MKLKEQETGKDGSDSILRKAKWIEELNIKEIPVITSCTKDEETQKHSLVTFRRLAGMADIIRTNSKRFRTNTEVRRAADYIGMAILFKKYGKEGEDSGYGHAFYEFLKRNEAFYLRVQLLEDFRTELKRLTDVLSKNLISRQEIQDRINEMINNLPDDMKSQVEQMANESCKPFGLTVKLMSVSGFED